MYTNSRYSSTPVMLKLCNSQTLWWAFYKLKWVQEPRGHFESAEQAHCSFMCHNSFAQSHFFSLSVTPNKQKAFKVWLCVRRQRRNTSFYLGIHLWPGIKTCCSQQVIFLFFLNINLFYLPGGMSLLFASKRILKMKVCFLPKNMVQCKRREQRWNSVWRTKILVFK